MLIHQHFVEISTFAAIIAKKIPSVNPFFEIENFCTKIKYFTSKFLDKATPYAV